VTRWTMLKLLAPWLGWAAAALLAAGFSAGFLVSDWRDQGAIERAKGHCADDRLAAERAARAFLESENERLARQAIQERALAESLRMRLRGMAEQAERDREELAHALSRTNLDRCDARRPAGVLRARAERYRRQIAAGPAHAGGADDATRRATRDAARRP
jgi:phage shock protein A